MQLTKVHSTSKDSPMMAQRQTPSFGWAIHLVRAQKAPSYHTLRSTQEGSYHFPLGTNNSSSLSTTVATTPTPHFNETMIFKKKYIKQILEPMLLLLGCCLFLPKFIKFQNIHHHYFCYCW